MAIAQWIIITVAAELVVALLAGHLLRWAARED